MKAFLVSAPSLAAKARRTAWARPSFSASGRRRPAARTKDSLLANLFEAMIAGVYPRRRDRAGAAAHRALLPAGHRRHRPAGPAVPGLQDRAPGAGAGEGLAAPRVQRGRRSRAGSRQDLHRRGEGGQSRRARRRLVEEGSAAAGGADMPCASSETPIRGDVGSSPRRSWPRWSSPCCRRTRNAPPISIASAPTSPASAPASPRCSARRSRRRASWRRSISSSASVRASWNWPRRRR